MTEEMPDPPDEPEATSLRSAILGRVIGPAAAIVILYASIRALPPLLMNRVPPINGGDLIVVFLVSAAVFSLWSLYQYHRSKAESVDK